MQHGEGWRARLAAHAIWLFLAVQALLLLHRLDRLPVWGDEFYTLSIASRPATGVVAAIAEEKNNPPLHTLLLHFLLKLPWPWGRETAARALSALVALIATLVLYRLWVRKLDREARLWWLALWALSPCLLLYARMARSYSLQILLFALALHAATRWLNRLESLRRMAAFALCSAVLLYTHYLPGLALIIVVFGSAALSILAIRKTAALLSVVLALPAILLLYLPWMPHLWVALGRLANAAGRSASGGFLASAGLGIGYWGFSFAFGETQPLWAMAVALVLAPALVYLTWKGLPACGPWTAPVVAVAALAFLVAARWVSFVFVPGRLVFLLPFWLMALAAGAARKPHVGRLALAMMLGLGLVAMAGYFRQRDFLNKAYLVPYDEITQLINRASDGAGSLVVADACNFDPAPIASRLAPASRLILVGCTAGTDQIQERILNQKPRLIWQIRNTHDISPGETLMRLEQWLIQHGTARRYAFAPYNERDKLLMRLLGWNEFPTHMIEALAVSVD